MKQAAINPQYSPPERGVPSSQGLQPPFFSYPNGRSLAMAKWSRLSGRGAAGLALAALLSACASAPSALTAAPVPPPARPTLPEMMKEAQDSVQAGEKDKARSQFNEAAKSYPTQKEPWVMLAEDYFESADYGNAILAAQEVTQRDPLDRTAQSILAVSGLRVASAALVTLRDQQSGMPTDTRSEARNLTKALRETLGEPLLVPPVVPAKAHVTRPPRQTRAGAASRGAAPATPPAADLGKVSTGAPAPTPSTASGKSLADKSDKPINPFDRLR